MSLERLFIEIFDRKSRIERQLYQQLESYAESISCNVIADGKRPPPWLLKMIPGATFCPEPGDCRQPSPSFWNSKRKTCSATWELMQGNLFTEDFDFNSKHNLAIAPTLNKKKMRLDIVDEIQNLYSRDDVMPTNLRTFDSEIHCPSQQVENLVPCVDKFQKETSMSHDGSHEGEEPCNAPQHLCGYDINRDNAVDKDEDISKLAKERVSISSCLEEVSSACHDGFEEEKEPCDAPQYFCECDINRMSDITGVKHDCDETMLEDKKLLYLKEGNAFDKHDGGSKLAKRSVSSVSHFIKEFPSKSPMDEARHCPMDEVKLANLVATEPHIFYTSPQIPCTSLGSEKLFLNVDTYGKKIHGSTDHLSVSIEGDEPNSGTQHLHKSDISGTSYTANVTCDVTMLDFMEFSAGLTTEIDISKDVIIPSLAKEPVSATLGIIEGIASTCSSDEVKTTSVMPSQSEIFHTSKSVEKLFVYMDTFEYSRSQSIGCHDGHIKSTDSVQSLHSGDISITEIAGDKPSCDDLMLEFECSSNDFSRTPDINVVFKDTGIPSFAKERTSIASHVIGDSCSDDEDRLTYFLPTDSAIQHNSHCSVDVLKNKASVSPGQHDKSELCMEPYDSLYGCSTACLSGTFCFKSNCDETMPEFEKFDMDLSNEVGNVVSKSADISSLAKERAFALRQLHQSRILLTPMPKTSIMDNMCIISDGVQSLPLETLKNMDFNFSTEHNNNCDNKHFIASSGIKLLDIFCNDESQLDGLDLGSAQSLSSSSARFGLELQNPPLSPPAINFNYRSLTKKNSQSPKKLSSNPELVCFRIDENSPTTEENVDVAQLGYSARGAISRNNEISKNSKPLSDVTSLYQNDMRFHSGFKEFMARESLESVNSDVGPDLGFECEGRESNVENKENPSHVSISKELKGSRTGRKFSERSRVSCRSSQRIMKQNLDKVCKASNIISSMSSFVPLIQKKQHQDPALLKKKDIKVKSLEAAEAAKRLEDRKNIERAMRKAAVKHELEKLKQENAKQLKLKRSQMDEKRRKEDAVARKRQREAEEKKIMEKKRQCIEEKRALQRDRLDKKEEKDIRQKALPKERKQSTKQYKMERRGDASPTQMVAEVQPYIIQPVSIETTVGNGRVQALEVFDEHFEKGADVSNSLIEVIEEGITVTQKPQELQSYELSPYQSSDDEDMEEDSWRNKKPIPVWARRESFSEIILANQNMDPKAIFSCKRSFNISQAFRTHSLLRG